MRDDRAQFQVLGYLVNETDHSRLPTGLFTHRRRYHDTESPHEVSEVVFQDVLPEDNFAGMRELTVHYRGVESIGLSACRRRDALVALPNDFTLYISNGCTRLGMGGLCPHENTKPIRKGIKL